MKILHINHCGSYKGGVEGYIQDIATELNALGHKSFLIYFADDDSGDLLPDSVHVPLNKLTGSRDQTIEIIEKIITSNKPDVVYLHTVYQPEIIQWLAHRMPTLAYIHAPYITCPGSARYLRRTEQVCLLRPGVLCLWNAQVEHCCWGHNPLKHFLSLRRVLALEYAYQNIHRILVGSKYMQQLLIREGLHPDRVAILPPFLIRKPVPEWEFDPDSKTILFAGRLTPEKGVSHLIEALALVKGDWKLVIAGDGYDLNRCKSLSKRLNLSERTEFIGWLSPEEMTTSLQNCAILAMPSLWPEPFGRLGPEAFVYGRPVVAYATGGISDWLDHGISGYLVKPRDITSLANHIQLMLDSPNLRLQMGTNARNKALNSWLAEDHAGNLLQFLSDISKSI